MTPNQSQPRLSPLVSDVLKLAGGTTFAQALAILAAPILTRLYAPEAFGVAALFGAVTGTFTVVACLRYERAIMLPKQDEVAANLLGLSLLIATGMSALMLLMIWLGGGLFLQLLNASELAPYLLLSPLAVFLGGLFLALNYWNSRTKRFGRLSLARINASISTTVAQIGAGVGGYPTGSSLIGASILGSAVSTLLLGGQIWRDDRHVFRKSIQIECMKWGLKRYRKFPLIETISTLLNTISWQLPTFLLSAFFSSSIVGFYALGNRVLQLPMSFIGSSISQVFFQRAAEVRTEDKLSDLVENVFKILVIISSFPTMILTFMGKDLFVVIFGPAWAEAGIYAQILGIYTFLWFISSPIGTIYYVLEKQEFGLKFNIINIIIRFLALLFGGLLGNPRISILLFAVSGIFVYSYYLIAIFKFSEIPICNAIKIILKTLRFIAPAAIIILALMALNVDILIQISVSVFMMTVYYLYIYMTDPLVKNIGSSLFRVGNR